MRTGIAPFGLKHLYNHARALFMLLIVGTLPTPTWEINYTSTGTGVFHSPGTWTSATGSGVPGLSDTATILGSHTVTVQQSIRIDQLMIGNGGTLIVGAPGFPIVEIEANRVDVSTGGVLHGFDAPGGGATVIIRGLSLGSLIVTNNGLIRGGNPYGHLFIQDSHADDTCANGSQIVANSGEFKGGDISGSVFMVAGVVQLVNSAVEAGSGLVPFNFFLNQSIAGSVYIGGVDIDLIGTTVTSGSNTNTALGAIAGTVTMIAYSCPVGTLGSLDIDGGSVVTVGTPIVNNCPGVLLFSSGTSAILGTVGPSGGANCFYWDPPDLELLDDGEIFADSITIGGENLLADNLTGTALEATDTIEITLAPGGVLDLRGLTPGTNYFQAGTSITLCADQILLPPATGLADLMSPFPQICPGVGFVELSRSPGVDLLAEPGSRFMIPLQVANVGNASGDVEMRVEDTAGWLVNGIFAGTKTLQPGDGFFYGAEIQVPPSSSAERTLVSLSYRETGQAWETETSVITILSEASIFADGFESGDTSRWSGTAPC